MELKCYLVHNKLLNSKGSEKVFPKVANYKPLDGDDFIDKVAESQHLGRAVICGVLAAVAEELVTWIGNGHAVTIENLGTFSVGMKGDVESDNRGVLQLKDAKVSKVNFIPSTRLKNKLSKVKFTLINHNVNVVTRPADDELMDAARRVTNEYGYFVRADFAEAAGISYNYAGKALKRLAGEGRLTDDGSGHYRVAE